MRAKKTGTDVRQEQILEAALDLIGEKGVYALNISSIAAKVGIVPSALYRHFKSKDDVLNGILNLLKKRLLHNVSLVRKETTGSLDRLRMLLMRQARMLSENPAIAYVVFSDGIYAGNPGRQARIANNITTHLGKIQEIVKEGIQDGSIRKDVDPFTASMMLLGIILPAAVLRNVSGNDFDMIAHAEKAWPVFVKAIEPGK